ncbi:MAG: Deoxyhypusine synthase [Vezdaea aestivalis]|nr:MAG: Deoxyhypusine synthase [Vezdaea aestivalis]
MESKPNPPSAPPAAATEAVLKPSAPVPEGSTITKGIDHNAFQDHEMTVSELVEGMSNMGIQAGAISKAVQIINEMRAYRDPETGDPTTIFLGLTSNLISSGLRDSIRYLVQHKCVSALVMTAGGVEEDLIKCLAPTYLGAFDLDGAELREKGMNRIGNMLVPNANYCAFEDWVVPLLEKYAERQCQEREKDPDWCWTPSMLIEQLGVAIEDESSVLYWAAKNGIPIFCPALTDGSLGDMMFFHSFRVERHLEIAIVRDLRKINTMAMAAKKAGMIILGGGLVKHHIANACLMRNGADYAVYINTAQEYDASDAGARPDEAISWGKIKAGAPAVKVSEGL